MADCGVPSISALDNNANRSKNSIQSTYHKRTAEQIVFRLVFDCFVAPVLASLRTLTAVALQLSVLFALSALSSHFGTVALRSLLHHDHIFALAGLLTGALLFVYCKFLSRYPSHCLALLTGGAAIVTAAFCSLLQCQDSFYVAMAVGASVCLLTLVYWFFLETNQKTLSVLLCHHYERVASIKPRKSKET